VAQQSQLRAGAEGGRSLAARRRQSIFAVAQEDEISLSQPAEQVAELLGRRNSAGRRLPGYGHGFGQLAMDSGLVIGYCPHVGHDAPQPFRE